MALHDAAAHPIKTHVNHARSALLDSFINYSACGRIIHHYWGGGLRMAHLLKRQLQLLAFVCICKQGADV
eukprot:7844185-Ditylum_brightwellii.AAC.1